MSNYNDTFTVSFFGHRELDNYFEVEKRLYEAIYVVIKNKESIDFLIGRNGEFDILVAATIKKFKGNLKIKI